MANISRLPIHPVRTVFRQAGIHELNRHLTNNITILIFRPFFLCRWLYFLNWGRSAIVPVT